MHPLVQFHRDVILNFEYPDANRCFNFTFPFISKQPQDDISYFFTMTCPSTIVLDTTSNTSNFASINYTIHSDG